MEELTPLLEQLAVQLGTTVEFLWEVLLYQARVEFIKGIMYWLIWIIFVIVGYRKVNFNLAEHVENNNLVYFVLAGFLGIALIVGLVSNIVGLGNVVDALLNPEFWALQQILEYVK